MSSDSLSRSSALLDLVDGPSLSIDDRLELLSDPHRRCVLEQLERTADPIDIDELASRVAGRVGGGRRETRLILHHNHLPKLDDYGVVDYEPSTGTVSSR